MPGACHPVVRACPAARCEGMAAICGDCPPQQGTAARGMIRGMMRGVAIGFQMPAYCHAIVINMT
jgi:hypothetical protein